MNEIYNNMLQNNVEKDMITQQGLQRASAFENRHYITLPESPALAAALKMTIGPAHQLLRNFLPSTSPLVEVSSYCVLTTHTHIHTCVYYMYVCMYVCIYICVYTPCVQ